MLWPQETVLMWKFPLPGGSGSGCSCASGLHGFVSGERRPPPPLVVGVGGDSAGLYSSSSPSSSTAGGFRRNMTPHRNETAAYFFKNIN